MWLGGSLWPHFCWERRLYCWVALIAGQLGNAHPDNVWVKEAYALKFAAAEKLRGQRKVLRGGSATMFGVDSQQLGLELTHGEPGVNAGIGSYEVPAQVDRWIEPGDVGMPLEYRLLLGTGCPAM